MAATDLENFKMFVAAIGSADTAEEKMPSGPPRKWVKVDYRQALQVFAGYQPSSQCNDKELDTESKENFDAMLARVGGNPEIWYVTRHCGPLFASGYIQLLQDGEPVGWQLAWVS